MIKIDFNNIENVDGHENALVFFKDDKNNEYAYLLPDDDNIYYVKQHDIYTYPKAAIREFILDRYNELSKRAGANDLFEV